jgi:hypothetical protein
MGTRRHPAVVIPTTHASRNVAPRRRSTVVLAMISSLLKWFDLHDYPAGGGGGGEPAGGMSGAAGTAGGGGAAIYACAGTHAQ